MSSARRSFISSLHIPRRTSCWKQQLSDGANIPSTAGSDEDRLAEPEARAREKLQFTKENNKAEQECLASTVNLI
ncbi:MAG: hypothetical protein U0936_25620 [Planctomycetaceae bacterium]